MKEGVPIALQTLDHVRDRGWNDDLRIADDSSLSHSSVVIVRIGLGESMPADVCEREGGMSSADGRR